MSTPIVEQIAANIETATNQITVAAGFNENLTCIRPNRLGYEGSATPADGKVVLRLADRRRDDENSIPGNPPAVCWWQMYALVAFVIAADDATTAIDIRNQQVAADLEKKLLTDPTRGGLAIDTVCRGAYTFDDGPAFSGITVMVECQYRTRENDPYIQA